MAGHVRGSEGGKDGIKMEIVRRKKSIGSRQGQEHEIRTPKKQDAERISVFVKNFTMEKFIA